MIIKGKNIISRNGCPVYWGVYCALLLSIQGGLLYLDHHPMFFLGDSASYIWASISGDPPTDRSFLYGYFIRLVAVSTQSLTSIVIAQVFLVCVASAAMAHLLIRYFQVRPWIAFIMALLTTLEPLQLLYTRYVMTETLALAVFVFYIWSVLHYLERPQIRWFVLIQSIAVLMIAIRFAFIPMAWIGALTIPLLALPAMETMPGLKTSSRLVVHLAMSVFLLFVFTTIYKHYHGYLQHKPPAYSYDSGFFSLSFIAPIVEPDDFSDKGLGKAVMRDLKYPVKDRLARAAHRWVEGGIVDRLQKTVQDRLKADAIARQTTLRAVVRKPLAFLELGGQTFTDYFNPSHLQSSMESDLGNIRLDDGFHDFIKKRFSYSWDQSSALDLKTLTGLYFLSSGRWLQFLLFVPLWWSFLIFFAANTEQRSKILFLTLISIVCIGVVLFLVVRPTPRFLHIPAWLFFLAGGVGLNRMTAIFNKR